MPLANHKPAPSFIYPAVPIAIFLAGLSQFLSSRYGLFDFPLDDAWIHQVYARSLAWGHGFAYNPGLQEAGESSPLWALVTVPAHWLEAWGAVPPALAVKIEGVLLGVVFLWLLFNLAADYTESPVSGLCAASIFALDPRFLFSTISGMEVILLITLWSGAAYAVIRQRWTLSCILIGLTPITRPEALVLLPVFLLCLVMAQRSAPWGRHLFRLVMVAAPALGWGLFCKYATGHWLPNTFYLKAHVVELKYVYIDQVWQAFLGHGFPALSIFFLGVALFLIWIIKRRDVNRFTLFMLTVFGPFVYLAGVAGSRRISPDGYYWTRWLDPAALILTVPFCIGYAGLLTGGMARVWTGRLGRSYARMAVCGLSALGIAGLVYSFPAFSASFTDRRDHLASDSRAINLINVQTGKWIAQNTLADAVVGVNDAGAIRYFGHRFTIDLIGLNNAEIAFKKVDFKQAVGKTDWLAVFPGWFSGAGSFPPQGFVPRTIFGIPYQDYTICPCPSQTMMAIFEKKPGLRSTHRVRPGRWSPKNSNRLKKSWKKD
ncbi:MAG: hypothetical protein HQK59_16435 [Deltaproteobacteria bacterium]|nr:hypothetical protein [Deltaproteobacteria bacterium]